MKPGQKIEMTELGKKILLPEMKRKVCTGTFIEVVSESGDIVRVQRDGLRKYDTTFAVYWQPAPNKEM